MRVGLSPRAGSRRRRRHRDGRRRVNSGNPAEVFLRKVALLGDPGELFKKGIPRSPLLFSHRPKYPPAIARPGAYITWRHPWRMTYSLRGIARINRASRLIHLDEVSSTWRKKQLRTGKSSWKRSATPLFRYGSADPHEFRIANRHRWRHNRVARGRNPHRWLYCNGNATTLRFATGSACAAE